MKELISLRLPLEGGQMTAVRLATGGVAASFGLGLDDSEDLKLCVTESLLLLLHAGKAYANVAFSEDGERLFICVTGEGQTQAEGRVSEDDISEALLEALSEDAAVSRREERVEKVEFRFSR